MAQYVRVREAIQWDGTNLDDVVEVIKQRGPGLGFGDVTEEADSVLLVPSGISGDFELQPGWWFVANDQMGEFLSDADFQARYRPAP